jgi:hypothetical protein
MIKESIMKTFITATICFAALVVATSSARADFGVSSLDVATSLNGEFSREAGEHADLTTDLRFTGNEQPRTLRVDLPAGLVGNPTAAGTCTSADLIGGVGGHSNCPISSQVGIVRIYDHASDQTPSERLAVFNMVPPQDRPALFAFNFSGVLIRIEPELRPSDYGIVANVRAVSQGMALGRTVLTLWGVPADASHDGDRFDAVGHEGVASPAPREPFLTNPTSCPAAPTAFSAAAESWQNPGPFVNASTDKDPDGTPFLWDGCDRLAFNPSVTVHPGSHTADSPTGLDVDISVPQSTDPDGLATAHVRKTVVRLPSGMSVSPSAAAGLGACAPSEIALGTNDDPTCPDSSKIGTVSIDTPLLADPLVGDVILATQNDNPFRSLVAMYLVVKGPGVLVKLPGKVDLDPVTGQLTATFDNTPQLPFSHLHVAFRGGTRAPLATPTACGTYTTHVEMTSWASDVPVQLDSPMTINEGCGRRDFAPSFSAGTTNPLAGADTPFRLTVTRADGTANLSRIDTVLPPGLLARIANVEQCPEPQATSGGCSAAAQIGSTSVLSGPGATPLALTGRVYLTGPYKDAPFGMSIVVPTAGQAGPFDLGDVIVRAGIYVDRTDAHATVKSDPLPTIIQGVPLRMRQVIVDIDRPHFMLNPTSCAPKTIFGGLESTDGNALTKEAGFQAVACNDLPVNHKLTFALTGKNATTDGTHPGIRARVTSASGAANLKTASVALPLSLALDPDNAQGLCKPEQRVALACPATSIVGHATAKSILPHPMAGPVYFVEGLRKSATGRTIRTLPKLWIPLSGDGVTIDLNADSEVRQDRLVTTFRNIPDAPIESFELSINGGKHGIVAVSGKPGTCDRSKIIDNEFTGQNGVVARSATTMSVQGCKPTVKHKKASSRSLTVQVANLAAGKLTVSGSRVLRAARTLKGASQAVVTLKWTKAARRTLLRRQALKVKLTTTFTPKQGSTVHATNTMTVKLKAR